MNEAPKEPFTEFNWMTFGVAGGSCRSCIRDAQGKGQSTFARGDRCFKAMNIALLRDFSQELVRFYS